MDILYISLEDYFNGKVKKLSIQEETKAYIVSIFQKYQSSQQDLSKKSLTLEFIKAREEYNFEIFQNLGDWIFWVDTIYNINSEYQNNLAKLSYYKCYQILNKKWKLFEELADEFEIITQKLKFQI